MMSDGDQDSENLILSDTIGYYQLKFPTAVPCWVSTSGSFGGAWIASR